MKATKWKPKMDGAWVSYVAIGFGQMMWFCYVPNCIAPIGFVWGWATGKGFHVAGSFVQPWARRNGVRSRINDAIFQHYRVISTSSGSKEGGKQFLKAKKYKRNELLDLFYLERPSA